jgi:dienelactone hydrolase
VIPLQSRTLTGEEFLRGDGQGRDVSLAGELRLPPGATEKVPAVVLVHGSGGISGAADLWARELNGIGIATFILDSFAGRGIVSTVADQNQLNSLAMMVDAYRALDLLAAHPRIRADRIAVMGFSKGAVASVYSATDRFNHLYGNPSHRFAAHIGLYTPCNVNYDADTAVAHAPLRLFHGIADDYVSIVPCRDYTARLKQAGADVTLTEYPDAQHGFDNPLSAPLVPVPSAQTTRNCRLVEGPGGSIHDQQTGEAYRLETSPCVEKGAHVGYNAQAATAVRTAVKEFLTAALLRQ